VLKRPIVAVLLLSIASVYFQKVPEAKAGMNRLHLDLHFRPGPPHLDQDGRSRRQGNLRRLNMVEPSVLNQVAGC